MKALLMFGPCHGMSMEVGGDRPIPEIYCLDPDENEGAKWMPADEKPWLVTRFKTHVYARIEAFSSEQGEDCVLYVHAENCCEETFLRVFERPERPRVMPY